MKLCLVGGFLGSGKTTAIANAAQLLARDKVSLAVITNDQGSQLVDAAFIASLNVPGGTVKNGCFCCNYDRFYDVIRDLKMTAHPDIIFAEAVGSCADLVATIVKPLNRSDPGMDLSLTVFADGPVLLSSLEGRSSFISDNVRYIYKKQLEEASLLIINKSDLLTNPQINAIESILKSEYAGKKLLFQDSREELAIKKWLDTMEQEHSYNNLKALMIDYDKYAEGEAALAWLDGYIHIRCEEKAIEKACQFMNEMFDQISFQHLPIAHLKFFVQSENWQCKISFTPGNRLQQGNSYKAIVANHAMITVNGRVETTPDQLKKIFYRAVKKVEESNSEIEVLDLRSFQPAYPRPTYRLAE